MATNFKVFDETNQNTFSDADYAANTSRLNGNVAGQVILSQLINTVLRSTSLITTSLVNLLTNEALGISSTEEQVTNALREGLRSFVYNTTVENATNAINATSAKNAEVAMVATAFSQGYGSYDTPIFIHSSGVPMACTSINIPITTKVDNATNSDTTTNITGGSKGSILYQIDEGKTSFIPAPDSSQIYVLFMTSQLNSPQWRLASELTTKNISGGNEEQLVYQSAPSVTSFLAKPTTNDLHVLTNSKDGVLQWSKANTLSTAYSLQSSYLTNEAKQPYNVGNQLVPVYFSGGIPMPCSLSKEVNNVNYNNDIKGVQSSIIPSTFTFDTTNINTSDECQLKIVALGVEGDSQFFLPNYVEESSAVGITQNIFVSFMSYANKTDWIKYEVNIKVDFGKKSANQMTASIPCIIQTNKDGTSILDTNDDTYKQFSFYLHKVYK